MTKEQTTLIASAATLQMFTHNNLVAKKKKGNTDWKH